MGNVKDKGKNFFQKIIACYTCKGTNKESGRGQFSNYYCENTVSRLDNCNIPIVVQYMNHWLRIMGPLKGPVGESRKLLWLGNIKSYRLQRVWILWSLSTTDGCIVEYTLSVNGKDQWWSDFQLGRSCPQNVGEVSLQLMTFLHHHLLLLVHRRSVSYHLPYRHISDHIIPLIFACL